MQSHTRQCNHSVIVQLAAATILVASRVHAQGQPPPEQPGTTPPAPPEPPIPTQRLVLNSLLVFRYNPLALEEQVRFGYQHRFIHREEPILRDNFLFLGIS